MDSLGYRGFDLRFQMSKLQQKEDALTQDTFAHTTQDAIVFVRDGPELVAGEAGRLVRSCWGQGPRAPMEDPVEAFKED